MLIDAAVKSIVSLVYSILYFMTSSPQAKWDPVAHCAQVSQHLGAHCLLVGSRGIADRDLTNKSKLHSSRAASSAESNAPTWASSSLFTLFLEPNWWWPTSEAALVADARAAVEWLVYERGVAPQRVVLWGHKMGSGVAASLSREWSDPVFMPHPVSSPVTPSSSGTSTSRGALPGGDADSAGGDLGAIVLESGFSSLADHWTNQRVGLMGLCRWLPGCHSGLLTRALHQSPFKLATKDHVAALVEQGAHTSVWEQIRASNVKVMH